MKNRVLTLFWLSQIIRNYNNTVKKEKQYNDLLEPHENIVIEILFRNKSVQLIDNFSEQQLEGLLNYCRKNGLAPLLFHRLNNENHPHKKLFKTDYLTTAFRNESLKKHGDELLSQFRRNSITYMPLKGFILSQLYYSDSSLRPMSDIDILVPPDQIDKTIDFLKDMKLTEASFDINKLDPTEHHIPLIMYKSTPVEIHRSLFPSNVKYNIPVNDIWQHKSSLNHPIYDIVIDIHQLFIYLTLHIYYTGQRGGLRLSWFYDLLVLIQNNSVQEDKLELWINKWKVSLPFSKVITVLNWLSPESLPDWLSQYAKTKYYDDIKQYIIFFRDSSQQINYYSYQLIWERLFKTKGFKNKLKFIWQRLSTDPQNPFDKKPIGSILLRLFRLISNTLKMLWNKTIRIILMVL